MLRLSFVVIERKRGYGYPSPFRESRSLAFHRVKKKQFPFSIIAHVTAMSVLQHFLVTQAAASVSHH